MSARGKGELLGAISRQMASLQGIYDATETAVRHDVGLLGRTANAAVMVAGLLDNYYTCLETLFLRVSQFFENNLDAAHWHTDLLEKMTIRVDGVREPVVSRDNYSGLLELLKFRHFRRYYFELQYDWSRLDFLLAKLADVHPRVTADVDSFVDFVKSI